MTPPAITEQSLLAEFGKLVDCDLIRAIWSEQRNDPAKCRNIVIMLSGTDPPAGEAVSHQDSLDSYSSSDMGLTSSELSSVPFSLTVTESETWSVDMQNSGPQSTATASTCAPSIDAITSADTLLEFLQACFPECSMDYLRTKANEVYQTDSSDFRADPVEAIDIISNALYNDLESVENLQYQHAAQGKGSEVSRGKQAGVADLTSTALEDIESKYTVAGAESKKKKKKQSKNRESHAKTKSQFARAAYQTAQGPSNAWSEINEELRSLSNIFPNLAVGTVRTTYHECGADIDATVGKLAEIAEKVSARKKPTGRPIQGARNSAPAPTTPQHDPSMTAEFISQLRQMFPDHDDEVLRNAAAEAIDIDDAVTKVLKAVEDQSAAATNGKKKSKKWRRADDLANHRLTAAGSGSSSVNAHDPLARVPMAALSGEAREWIADHHVDSAYCRRKAQVQLDKRNELYRKAAAAYTQRTKAGSHSATALYYSIEGHKCDARARIWNMRAAQATVAAMKHTDRNTIDLHGLTRPEAVALVQEEVTLWHLQNQSTDVASRKSHPLHIITGLGTHSTDGMPRIHPSIVKVLRNEGWWFEEGNGFINVIGVREGNVLV
ncbi:hypothetical protein DL89DRAFT_267873 [Linderina pennispora]|uniref:Smr domain-containing protein n=1 Tax=Linderina pennispora TaxID=61395 RepID=A0A1Y1W845_9FUNG|nr:uncharacterized protein DL89DRAFT_267873 [Linderina pennispora]ORX69697.1 hypothetical protein DL89DRAFT_267873 [Linderina pennispora]